MNKLCPEAVHPRGPAEGARSHDQYDHQVSELGFFFLLLILPVMIREEEDHDKEDEAFVKELLLHTTKYQLLEHTPREPRNHAARRMRWHGKKLLCSTPNCEFQ